VFITLLWPNEWKSGRTASATSSPFTSTRPLPMLQHM